jgi:hypothetical protein
MAPLPRVACFHGGGSSAAIYAVQCEALQRQLASTFVFEFFEAPFERDAGPGVLPFFKYEKFGPYKTWFQKTRDGMELADGRSNSIYKSDYGAGGGIRGEGGIERVWRMLRGRDAELELDGREDEMGEWVGVMGFSQGTRIVGGLLLDLQRRKDLGLFRAGDIDFKFGVLCMGSGPPMLSDLASGLSLSSPLLSSPSPIHVSPRAGKKANSQIKSQTMTPSSSPRPSISTVCATAATKAGRNNAGPSTSRAPQPYGTSTTTTPCRGTEPMCSSSPR